MMNAVVMIGRLTKDVELRYTQQGKAVATFSVAVDRPYAKDQTDFFNIVVWGKTAENCANYLAKGRLAGIKGQIQNRSYDAQDGTKKYITEIIADQVQFLEKAQENSGLKEDIYNTGAEVFTPKSLDDAGYKALDDDDVPF